MNASLFLKMFVFTAREIGRDFMSLFFSFAFPVLFMVLFGFTSQANRTAPSYNVGVVLLGNASAAEPLMSALTREPGIMLRNIAAADIEDSLRKGEVASVLRITGHAESLPQVEFMGNGGDVFLRATVSNAILASNYPKQAGEIKAVLRNVPLEVHSNYVTTFLIPGLTAMALIQLGLFGTANPIMIARARGTFRHLTFTPLPTSVLVASHILVRLLTAGLQILMMLGLAVFWLDVRLDGGWLGVLLIHALGAVMLIALGFLIAGNVPNETAGGGLIVLINFAMIGLSDIFFPTQGISGLNVISALMPVTYFSDASRQLIVGSEGRFSLGFDILMMAGFTAVFLVVAVKTFKFGMKKA
jgi:ABC-2 type transport system permease protein